VKTISQLEEELQDAICGMNSGDIETASAVLQEARMYERLRPVFVQIYNAGYLAGHHYTVEGGFAVIHESDKSTYHSEEVEELLEGLLAR